MKKIFILLSLSFSSVFTFAQGKPQNNLGKSLSTMKREFPELRYLQTEPKGNLYEDGYPEDGIAIFFYFKNGVVIEECLICESDDGFPKMWYDNMWEGFANKYPYAIIKNTYNYKVLNFGSFKIKFIFSQDYSKNTAMIIYSR